ncbi:MAG TPA: hypothetical protein VFU41_06725 [Gemmatimonadales bacterium]|nr:hypothetical protein [Gemmatimonadales bacterium]
MRTTLLLLALAATAREVVAQTVHATAGGSVVSVRVRSRLPGTTRAWSGAAFGGEGSLGLGRVRLTANYSQGTLNPDGGTEPSRDVVEGSAMLSVRLLRGLRLAGGPRARTYVFAGGTQRWLFWELRARAEGMFIGSAVSGHAELWRAVSTDVNVLERLDHAQGGEAGMTVHLSRLVDARLAYRIDHAVLGGGSRVETVDGLVVGMGLARR